MITINGVKFHHTPDEWSTLDMAKVAEMSKEDIIAIVEQLVHDIKATRALDNVNNPLPESMGR
jgi:hypothetical protein